MNEYNEVKYYPHSEKIILLLTMFLWVVLCRELCFVYNPYFVIPGALFGPLIFWMIKYPFIWMEEKRFPFLDALFYGGLILLLFLLLGWAMEWVTMADINLLSDYIDNLDRGGFFRAACVGALVGAIKFVAYSFIDELRYKKGEKAVSSPNT